MTPEEPSAEDPTAGGPTAADLVAEVHRSLQARGATIAVAESLTGGLLGATLTDVAGASATFRGGVVAYATALKASLLDVDGYLLHRNGPVHPDVAAAMARGVAARLQATYGLATTGVAGPEEQDGHQPGEVHVAVAGPGIGRGGCTVRSLRLCGGRDDVRRETVRQALLLVVDELAGPGKTER